MSVLRTGSAGQAMLLLCVNTAFAETTGPFGTREQSANAPGEVLPLAVTDRNIMPDVRAESDRLATKLNALLGVVNHAPILQSLRESLAEYRPVAVDTPEQRKGPACQYPGEPDRTPMSGLDVHCSDPRGMIVELNPAFFDTKPPVRRSSC